MEPNIEKAPNFFLSLIPVAFLLFFLGLSIYNFGDNCSSGPNQIVLFASTVVVFIVAMISKQRYEDLEKGMIHGITSTIPACLILLFVGILIGIWFVSGTVSTMIYIGMNLLNVKIFYACVAFVCAIISMCIGSSWNTAATVGIAFLGISKILGLDPVITTGAIISGSYFGDKMSPLSETTNLASAVSVVNIFAHIKSMMWTTIPSITIAIIAFAIIGFSSETKSTNVDTESIKNLLSSTFNISLWCLIPIVILVYLAIKKYPPIFTIFVGIISGLLVALIFQYDAITSIFNTDGSFLENTKALWTITYDGLTLHTDNKTFNDLLSGGGMFSMLNVVLLILSAMCFGSVMEYSGCLYRIMTVVLKLTNSAGKLVLATLFTCLGVNLISGEQCMGVILPGKMYLSMYKEMKIAPTVMSRSLEDGATITSVLIPWSTCGVFFSDIMGISTLEYMPYCLFNITNFCLAVIFALLGIRIVRLKEHRNEGALEANKA